MTQDMNKRDLVKNNVTMPELVAPAGDWESLSSAVASGADAVYFGVKGLNMRHAARNFDLLELKKVMGFLRAEERKGYLALNVMIHDGELEKVDRVLSEAASAGVDAVILWDMAVLSLASKHGLTIHLSTQASVSNFEALKIYNSLGVKRVVLARECSLEEISRIKEKISQSGIDCGIETFVHGAMCVSVSGRCFLSHESFSRSANRGDCLQPCRREYLITDTETNKECEYILGKDYVLSAKDLCAIKFIDSLMRRGVDAFKIEGRMRSPEYVRVVTASYRNAMDAFGEGRLTEKLKEKLFKDLSGTFNRGFTSGFFDARPEDLGGKPEKNYEKVYVGKVSKYYRKIGVAEILVQSTGIKKGDRLLVTGTRTPASFFEAGEMEVEHRSIEAMGPGGAVGIKIPFQVRRDDKVFFWKET
jgi:U32 family peptidase